WYVMEATETGEVIALAGVPYRLGLDPISSLNPSSPVTRNDAYCTQGFTYTFAMAATAEPQPHTLPEFYPEYEPYFSYERARDGYSPQDYYDFVFTYRRIWSAQPRRTERIIGAPRPQVGDISMQNWTWGNDYRPGTAADNLIYSPDQLLATGQLEPGGWLGGLRPETLERGEENALSFYYWLAEGTTDSQLGDDAKEPFPNSRLLTGYDAPMGTAHGLSKHPYIREGRRIVGRPAYGYDDGFEINEVDFTRIDFSDPFYEANLGPQLFLSLRREVASRVIEAVLNNTPAADIPQRRRSRIYADSVGIANYTIDFHPCMAESPPEKPGNIERPGVRQAHGPSYPTQIPLRSLIPQKVDNLLVAGKSIATSTIAAAAYRVHSFEWSVGVGAAATIDFALRQGVLPYELVDDLPSHEPLLDQLRWDLERQGNPTQFPNTTRTNEDWDAWNPGW
ncbi:MAG: FAD-dependent oxidoreductase, partial [Cyanobacteria bacterium]|nr:FAD-dependent oxidoreductase [Cyanobacteriota bacterium]